MSNFAFLEAEWPDLHIEATHAERVAVADPQTACFYARRCLEIAMRWLYQADSSLKRPERRDLAAMIAEPSLASQADPKIRTKMDLIRRQGNDAVHGSGRVAANDAVRVVAELFHVMYWMARTYSRNPADLPGTGLSFDPSFIPRPLPADIRLKKQAELKAQAALFAQQQAELEDERRKGKELDAELVKLRADIQTAKAANTALPDDHDYNEAETRSLIIDLLLKEAGWPLDQKQDREFPVTGMPTKTGKGTVDYVLWDDNGKPLGLVEAKRTTRDPRVGQQQAVHYADCLEKMFGQRPIIFYTNGYDTHIWDNLHYPPRPVQGFYTKDELRLLIQRRVSRVLLASVSINEEIVARHYQTRAIRRVGETFERERRAALLVMATGAGKTRTVIALADQLMRANWVKRVLFLADRQALVTQAHNAFKQHLPGAPAVNLLTEKDDSGRVFVSTYPTMMGLINETKGDQRRFGPGYFDLIVIDEAHRSIYRKYGAIFDYFDALLVGLTATPKDEVDRNTYRRFDLDDKVPTDSYSLEEAVAEGYLVPPRTVDVPLRFQRHGIRYDELSDEEKEAWDEAEWSEDGTIPTEVNPEELNKYLFNADTVDKALATLMTEGLKIEGGDKLGKTIIFAKNQAHADFIAERFDASYPHLRGEFARVITHKDPYAQSLITSFATPTKNPQIAISVDMLDTGVDVPEVVNLVFFKLVRSRTKFMQMIGRGTRLCADLFGPNQSKDHFLVFDLCQNVEYFNQDMAPTEGRLAPSLTQQIFERRADLLLGLDQRPELSAEAEEDPDGTHSEAGLRREVARRLQQEVAGMNLDNVLVRPYRRQVEEFADPASWAKVTPEKHDELTHRLAALPTGYQEGDDSGEEAKRFDLLVLRLQLAILQADPGYTRLRTRVQEIASALLDQTTIPAVRDQQELLDELTTDEWWQDVTLPMLESMRRRVRGLVRLIEKTKRGVVYTDFEDQLGELSSTQLQGIVLGSDRTRFEAKVRTYLRSHEDQPAVQKLRHNQQITEADLGELERIFLDSGFGTGADVEQVKSERGGLGHFVRSLTGLDRGSVAAAFEDFRTDATATPRRRAYLDLLIDMLAKNGVVAVGQLYESPFSSIAPGGPEDVFTDAEIDVLVAVLGQVEGRAVPNSSTR
ncbi:DEAD/DEAH box helicase family protein [Frankia sp. Mgl5]|uniref:DEAD/DEAH box helicase family protein n=1 Tax=Frankia sp. Mgl5 TaxID=2933793 RepID=UPI0020105463|nr:DEAD/DEAH box helicase family protein [Frankia sp. Mgl5]MCK9928826.1 DEAD/DEAH box helicase family protein [Frankia sp. Mgl5]